MDDELMELEKKLSAKQRRFVEALEHGLNGKAAAKEAGYGKTSDHAAESAAYKLLRNEDVMRYRQAKAKIAWEAAGITPEQVKLNILEIYERCMTAVPVMKYDHDEKKMVESGEWMFNPREALNCMKLIGGELGLFSTKVECNGRMSLEAYLRKLEEEENR